MKTAIDLAIGLVIIALFAAAGDLIVGITRVPVPAPILGMALFAVFLLLVPGLRARVERAAMALTGLLGALIVPPFVGLVLFRDELGANFGSVAIIILITTPLTAVVTALSHRWIKSLQRADSCRDNNSTP